MELRAVFACLVAFVACALLARPVALFATRVGAVDPLRERGLALRATPLFGGLAILGGVLLASLLFLPLTERTRAILAAALLITAIGALDDIFDLHAAWKLLGQTAAALI